MSITSDDSLFARGTVHFRQILNETEIGILELIRHYNTPEVAVDRDVVQTAAAATALFIDAHTGRRRLFPERKAYRVTRLAGAERARRRASQAGALIRHDIPRSHLSIQPHAKIESSPLLNT